MAATAVAYTGIIRSDLPFRQHSIPVRRLMSLTSRATSSEERIPVAYRSSSIALSRISFGFAQDGWASTPDAQITTFFVNDMSAMMFSGTHMFSQINDAAPDFEYGWFAVPDRDGKVNLLGGGTAGGWALSAEAAKDPDKQAAFDAFCKYFFSSDVYGAYCEAMAAIPTTVETPKMNTSEQFKSVLDALSAADYTHLMWNQEVGNRELPPDFRNFTYKTCIEVAQGSRDVASASSELQKTWNVALQSFNPTTGLGVE